MPNCTVFSRQTTPPTIAGIYDPINGQFVYSTEYLNTSLPALHPIELPKQPEPIQTQTNSKLFATFAEMLPGDCGSSVLKSPQPTKTHSDLAKIGPAAFGSLYFTCSEIEPDTITTLNIPNFDFLQNKTAILCNSNLLANFPLLELILNWLDGQETYQYEAVLNGARPKIAICCNGTEYIVKLSDVSDLFDNPKNEYECLKFAKHCGVRTADTEYLKTPNGSALAVKRFDVQENGTRCHLLSLAAVKFDDPTCGYAEIAKICTERFGVPITDIEELYRRLIVNVLVGNGDNHCRNQLLLHNGEKWELSPAFDVTTTKTENVSLKRSELRELGEEMLIASGMQKLGARIRSIELLHETLRLADTAEITKPILSAITQKMIKTLR